jgi:hypothetical protein
MNAKVGAITAAMRIGLTASLMRTFVRLLTRMYAAMVIERLIPLKALTTTVEWAHILPIRGFIILR